MQRTRARFRSGRRSKTETKATTTTVKLPPSGQPDAPTTPSPIQAGEYSAVHESQNSETVQQRAQVELPRRRRMFRALTIEPYIKFKAVNFRHIDGPRRVTRLAGESLLGERRLLDNRHRHFITTFCGIIQRKPARNNRFAIEEAEMKERRNRFR